MTENERNDYAALPEKKEKIDERNRFHRHYDGYSGIAFLPVLALYQFRHHSHVVSKVRYGYGEMDRKRVQKLQRIMARVHKGKQRFAEGSSQFRQRVPVERFRDCAGFASVRLRAL